MKRLMLTAALVVAGGPVFADITAIADTELNLRTGPGVGAQIAGVIDPGSTVVVKGCITGSEWCQVTHGDKEGWASGSYLSFAQDGRNPMVLHPTTERDQIVDPVMGDDVVMTTTTVGELIPGGSRVVMVDTRPEVHTYVLANPVDQILLGGEVVVGAAVPETVQLYEVPDSDLRYAYLNGVPVLIQPTDRTIVRIVRN